ncbi:MAG TPA: Xaa-Pro peptidase family protein [Patescibacteria group bacterium]
MNNNRLKHIRSLLEEFKIDSFLVSSNINIHYLSGFNRFLKDHDGYYFITKDNAYLITSPLYSGAVKKYTPEISLLETTPDKWYTDHVVDIVTSENIQKIGFEEYDLRVGEYWDFADKKLQLVPLPLRNLRIKKDKEEIEAIERACLLSDKAYGYILNEIHEGISELELDKKLEQYIVDNGGSIPYQAIVAFSENSAVPHHMTGDEKLQKDSFVLFDFMATVDSYLSDMSRTVFLGKPTKKQMEMHDLTLKSQEKAMSLIQELWEKGERSIPSKLIDDAARKVIEDKGYASYPHALGHGIGLEVHEAPALSRYAKDNLEEGMVFTIEPGVYELGYGGVRIEDMYVLEEKGLRQITQSTKELIVI